MLLVIWMLEAALPRTAEKAARLMRLPRTVTLPARNTLMALPYWPEPPGVAISSMRLSMTSVPSSPFAERDQDAVIAGAAHGVALDHEPTRIERVDRDDCGLGDGGADTVPCTPSSRMPPRP